MQMVEAVTLGVLKRPPPCMRFGTMPVISPPTISVLELPKLREMLLLSFPLLKWSPSLGCAGSNVKCWGSSHLGQTGYGDTATRGLTTDTVGDHLPLVDRSTMCMYVYA